jgi:hypothetical protein
MESSRRPHLDPTRRANSEIRERFETLPSVLGTLGAVGDERPSRGLSVQPAQCGRPSNGRVRPLDSRQEIPHPILAKATPLGGRCRSTLGGFGECSRHRASTLIRSWRSECASLRFLTSTLLEFSDKQPVAKPSGSREPTALVLDIQRLRWLIRADTYADAV